MEATVFSDEYFMQEAIKEAKKAFAADEVPVGAVIVCNNKIIARAHNLTELLNDVTAHAEMQTITSASNFLNGKYLDGCTLYVTLEPCVMCAGAIAWAQFGKLIYGASDTKRGFNLLNLTPFPSPFGEAGTPGQEAVRKRNKILHPKTVVISGVLKEECALLIKTFFQQKR